jgi:hypothetical protein
MNSVLARQYSIVLDAIDQEKPNSYLALLRGISAVGARRFQSSDEGFLPTPVSELVRDMLSEGLVERHANYSLTSTGKRLRTQTVNMEPLEIKD